MGEAGPFGDVRDSCLDEPGFGEDGLCRFEQAATSQGALA